jgi:DNA-binding NarL/FixJ family response regulator
LKDGEQKIERSVPGASGYIMKEATTDEVLRALRKALAGELYFSERVAAAVVQRTLREKPIPRVTASSACRIARFRCFNFSALQTVCRRLPSNFILAAKTVETHCYKIKHKLSLQTAAELKRFARQWAAEKFGPSEPSVTPLSQNSQSNG